MAPLFGLRRLACRAELACERRLVGPGRVERPTSRLSGVRSNHLSYEPDEVFVQLTPDAHRPCTDTTERKGNEGGGKVAILSSDDVWDTS